MWGTMESTGKDYPKYNTILRLKCISSMISQKKAQAWMKLLVFVTKL